MNRPSVIYRFGAFEVEPERRALRSAASARPVAVSAKLFDTLLYLVEHRGRLVEKRELLEAVWPQVIVTEATLTQTISTLRRALGEDPRAHEYIATIAGRGYQFVAPVEEVAAESAAAANGEAGASLGPGADQRRLNAADARAGDRTYGGRSWRLAYGLIVLVAVAGALTTARWGFDRAAERETAAVLPNSVAVLPFQDLSPNPDDASLVLGIHQEIIRQLAKIGDLNVIPRSSVLRYDSDRIRVPEVAAELRVEAVVRGSMHYAGERIEVAVELIDGASGTLIWSEESAGDLLDVVAIQSRIASAITEALDANLLLAERQSIATRPTENPAAYGFYLRAVDALAVRSPEGLAYLDRAIAIDPDFALTLGLKAANLSWALVNTEVSVSASSEEHPAIEREALELAAKALRLDPNVSSAWVARGNLHQLHWRWNEAGAAYARAVELGAKDAETLNAYASFNNFVGNHELAVELTRRVIEADPAASFTHFIQGWALAALRRNDESLAAIREALRLDPTSVMLQIATAHVAIPARRHRESEQASRAAEQMLEGHPNRALWLPPLAYGYALIGLHDDALRLVKEYEELPSPHDPSAGDRTVLHLAMRDEEKVVESLNAAIAKMEVGDVDPGFVALMSIKYNLLGDPMLEQPQLVALRGRILGLPPP